MSLGSWVGGFAMTALALVPRVGFAHCSNTFEVASAAHEFSDAAEHFHELMHDLTGYSHLAGDAHHLSDEAEYFHQEVEAGAECDFIQQEFEHVADDYRHLQRAFFQADNVHHDPHARNDFEDLHQSYHLLEEAVFHHD